MTEYYAMGITQFGAPLTLQKVPLKLGTLTSRKIRIKHVSIGLNYIDTYHRSGLYPIELPAIIGSEAVGVVEDIGTEVTDIAIGDTVGYCSAGIGAYATHRHVEADKVFPIPASIPADQAAACLLKGLTTEYLIRRTFRVESGQTVLFHAIAGGVGMIACQWMKQLGANVIGTVSTARKAEIASANGCDHVIRYDECDFAAKVQEITEGKGVPVVFDGVGKDTFAASLECLQPRGMMVSFGNASGAVDPVAPSILAQKGSLFLTRPTLGHYVATKEALRAAAADFFATIDQGLQLHCDTQYALEDVAQAHRDLEARKIVGQVVLLP